MDKTFTRTALCTALVLAGCGGGGAQIGGTVSGLASGAKVTLQNNGSDTLTVARTAHSRSPPTSTAVASITSRS